MAISSVRGEQAGLDSAPAPALHPVELEPSVDRTFSRALRGLGREIDVGELRVDQASQLRSYDTGTLIALQAGIYRYTEAVDLASKIVDRATSAVHTVLSSGGR